MYGKHFIIIMMLCIVFCFGTIAEATEKPKAKTTGSEKTEPAIEQKLAGDEKVTAPVVPAESTQDTDDSAPKAFVPQKRFAFPSSMDGTKVLHDFIIQNKGDAPLKITKVKTG